MSLFSDDAERVVDPYLRRAYVLAERGRGTTSPNPMVGCVVVRHDVVVGEGFHERAGESHAEAAALSIAGDAARGADVYVTLEPCNHVGRTPPCTGALIAAGVRSVTIGMPDPNTAVSGGGARALAEAGIDVRWAVDPGPFARQNEAWRTRLRTGIPFVRVKVAVSLDGRVALQQGVRARISGDGGSALTMRLRSEATAVVVGAGTVGVDDPLLTVRDARGELGRQPRRYVLARTSVPSPAARIFGVDGATLVVGDAVAATAAETLGRDGRVLAYDASRGLRAALAAIADDGCDDVLVEAGPGLFSALWHERLIDELVLVTAGGVAGEGAPALYAGCGEREGGALNAVLECVEAGISGSDSATVWRPREADVDDPGKGSA